MHYVLNSSQHDPLAWPIANGSEWKQGLSSSIPKTASPFVDRLIYEIFLLFDVKPSSICNKMLLKNDSQTMALAQFCNYVLYKRSMSLFMPQYVFPALFFTDIVFRRLNVFNNNESIICPAFNHSRFFFATNMDRLKVWNEWRDRHIHKSSI